MSPIGLFKSIDGGDGWIDLSAGAKDPFPLPPLSVELYSAVTVDPSDSAILYLPTWVAGVLRSIDAGVHWSGIGIEVSRVTHLARHPQRRGTMFASTADGVFRTFDDGASWTLLSIFGALSPATVVAFDPIDASRLRAGAGSSVLRSANLGNTWAQSDLAIGLSENVTSVLIDPSAPNTVYAATCGLIPTGKSSAYTGRVVRSDDGGVTWPPAVTFPPPTFATCVNSLVIDRGPPEVLYAGGVGGVFTSTDRGASWTGGRMEGFTVTRLVQDPTHRGVLYALRSSDLVVSADAGATWRPIGDGLPAAPLFDLAVDSADSSFLYAATEQGVYVSRTSGEHWTSDGLHTRVTSIAVDAAAPRTLFAGTDGQGILRQRVIDACNSASQCDDTDPCTVDRCEPTSTVADLDGCVHDRGDLPGVRCALVEALARQHCTGPRIEHRIDAYLTRAMQLVDRAVSVPSGRSRTRMIRGAKHAMTRLVHDLRGVAKRRQSCVAPLRDRIAGIRSTLRLISP
jgi:photosystem II stability/assembly factor-like uncharacterized protein